MATFLLIHGAWQGAWAWDILIPHLEAAGHTGIAVELPGDGHDDTPPETVTTMLCAEKVAGMIDQIEGPVIVVGHSMGGTVASQVSELRPDRISLRPISAPSYWATEIPASISTRAPGKTG